MNWRAIVTIASEASRRFDRDAEERLQLRQDIFATAKAVAKRLENDWPKNTHPNYTSPRLMPMCYIGSEQAFLGEDGSIRIMHPDSHFPRKSDLRGLTLLQLQGIKAELDLM